MGIGYANFIDETGVDHLQKYKYTSCGYTTLDLALNSWWIHFTNYLPRWLAPNLITILAALSTVLPCCVFLYVDPSFSHSYPSWMYFMSAFGIFMYQTLDAADGKQARRIQASSPLGQLLDHGCDS